MEINVKLVSQFIITVNKLSERKKLKFFFCSGNEWDLLRYEEESGEV